MYEVIHNPDPGELHSLIFRGTPADLADCVMEEDDPSTYIGGLLVMGWYTAKHDGKDAFGFKLADKMGHREVGRLVLLDTDTWFDDLPEWKVFYTDESEALENLKIFTARRSLPKTASAVLDFSFEGDLEEELAIMSAKWGVSCRVLDPHGPGGGNPVIEFSGLTENLERMLRSNEDYGFNFDEEEMESLFYSGLKR